MEDEDFLKRIGDKLHRFEETKDIAAGFRDAEKIKCQEFLSEFSVIAERNILPVFRSIEPMRSDKVAIDVEANMESRVALTITIKLGSYRTEKYYVAFVPNCRARTVSVELMRGGGVIDLKNITENYVRLRVEEAVSLIDR